MKKILLFASALAGLFLAGSCQRENLEPQQTEQQVTFTIEAPAALQTKAIADGLNVNELIYEVWITEAQNAETLDGATRLYQAKTDMQYDETNKRMKANITLDLVNDQNFTVLFWAQKEGIDVYDTEWLNAVTYTNLAENAYAANDARLDAFYSKAYVVDCQTATPTVVLRRPFAQVNLCTLNSKDAAQVAGNYNMTLVSSEMRLDAVPTVFNVATSEATNYVAMDFAVNAVPSGVDQKITVNNQDYYYAGMNYVFAGANIVLTYDIQAQLNGTVDVNINNTIQNVPLKENHRTNIVGNLLTSQTDFEIIVDAAFNEPAEVVEVVSVSTATELVQAIEAATTDEGESTSIKLEGDINLSDLFAELTKSGSAGHQSITVPAGKELTLDLNGYTLTGVDEAEKSFGLITNNGNLTIANSSSNPSRIALVAVQNRGWNAYSSVISNNPNGNLLVKGNVVIEHLGGTDMAYGIDNLTNSGIGDVNVTIDGATVKSPYRAIRQFLNCDAKENNLIIKAGSKIESTGGNKSVWMQDSSKKANRGSLVVEEGAELYGNVYISATAGSTEWPVSASVAASALKAGSIVEISPKELVGYNVVLNDGVYVFEQSWSVEGDEYTIYTAAGLKWIAEEVNSGNNYFAGKTVALANDIDLKDEEWTPIGTEDKNFEGNFEGNNKVVKNLKITTHANTFDGYAYAGLFGVTAGSEAQHNSIKNLVIENVNIQSTGAIVAAAVAYPYYTDIENITVKGNINIKGGDYTSGALAYTRRCVNAKNITVAGNDGSTIEGTQTIGGVISDIQMNGGLTANYSNFKASGLTIKGMKSVGGISGIICQQTLNGAVVENVVIVCNDVRKGIVSGCIGGDSTINNITANNVTGATNYVGATYDTGKTYKLTIDGVVYECCNGYYKADGKAFVSNADGLVAALEANEDVVFMNDIKIEPANMSNAYGKTGINVKNGQTIDGNGYTLNIKGAGGTWDSGINTTGGLIKNLTVTGSFRGIFINHNSDHSEKVVLENVTIGGNGTVYTISCDQGKYQGIEATNCTFNGWTSFAATAGEAKFVNCSFGEGSGYKYCRPYSDTEFVNCTFCPGYAVDTTRATVTFTDCTWEE